MKVARCDLTERCEGLYPPSTQPNPATKFLSHPSEYQSFCFQFHRDTYIDCLLVSN